MACRGLRMAALTMIIKDVCLAGSAGSRSGAHRGTPIKRSKSDAERAVVTALPRWLIPTGHRTDAGDRARPCSVIGGGRAQTTSPPLRFARSPVESWRRGS